MTREGDESKSASDRNANGISESKACQEKQKKERCEFEKRSFPRKEQGKIMFIPLMENTSQELR
jgi:hypothetical protein